MQPITSKTAATACPLGAVVTPAELYRDPYPFFERIRDSEPITWVASLNMWFVTRYADVRAILVDTERFTTADERSTVFDTFGAQMLTTEGTVHDRYRGAMKHTFMPQNIKQHLEPAIRVAANRLVDAFQSANGVELREAFASRLPVQTMLLTLDMPLEHEHAMRNWYDRFERALANFTWDGAIRSEGHQAFVEFYDHVGAVLRDLGAKPRPGTLLDSLVSNEAEDRLSQDEIIRNLAIIFFGGISTVEALILNSLWALLQHRDVLERVRSDPSLIPMVVDEAARWMSPVQSATRHAVMDCEVNGIRFLAGETVSCMLGAANRDPRVFERPDRFDIDRPNAGSHLGFAAGPHHCLGLRLAKAQGRIALETIIDRLSNFELVDGGECVPEGYEFRQPRALRLVW